MAEMRLWTHSRVTSVLWGDSTANQNQKEFPQYLHVPTKSSCWFCCCAFRITFSSERHPPSAISLNTCHQLAVGFRWAWKGVHKRKNKIKQKMLSAGVYRVWFLNSFFPNFVTWQAVYHSITPLSQPVLYGIQNNPFVLSRTKNIKPKHLFSKSRLMRWLG